MITALTLPLLISCVVVLQTLTDEFLHRPGTLELGEFGELSLHLESILHQPIEMSSGSLNLIDNKCHLICILVSHGPEKSFFWLVASMHSTMNRHLQSWDEDQKIELSRRLRLTMIPLYWVLSSERPMASWMLKALPESCKQPASLFGWGIEWLMSKTWATFILRCDYRQAIAVPRSLSDP